MTRREFLATCGAGAALVAVGGIISESEPLAHPPLDVDLRIGDVITIAGRYAINPITRESTGRLQQFVIVSVDSTKVTLHPSVEHKYSWPANVTWR